MIGFLKPKIQSLKYIAVNKPRYAEAEDQRCMLSKPSKTTDAVIAIKKRVLLIWKIRVAQQHKSIWVYLSKQLDIKTNRSHEEIDICQALAGHSWRKSLSKGNGLHDTILDGHDKALLLFWAGSNSNGGEELPDVDIFTGVNGAREDVWKSALKDIEKVVVSVNPMTTVSCYSLKGQMILTTGPTPARTLHHSA